MPPGRLLFTYSVCQTSDALLYGAADGTGNECCGNGTSRQTACRIRDAVTVNVSHENATKLWVQLMSNASWLYMMEGDDNVENDVQRSPRQQRTATTDVATRRTTRM